MNDIEIVVLAISLVLMFIGLAATLIPPLPSTVIIWAVAAFYGLILGWDTHLGWLTFAGLTFLMVLSVAIETVSGYFGAKLSGTSWQAEALGIVLGLFFGIIVSFFSFNPILGCLSGLLGMVAGVILVEWRQNRDWDKVNLAIQGYCAGTAVGIIAKAVIGMMMVGLFLWRVFS